MIELISRSENIGENFSIITFLRYSNIKSSEIRYSFNIKDIEKVSVTIYIYTKGSRICHDYSLDKFEAFEYALKTNYNISDNLLLLLSVNNTRIINANSINITITIQFYDEYKVKEKFERLVNYFTDDMHSNDTKLKRVNNYLNKITNCYKIVFENNNNIKLVDYTSKVKKLFLDFIKEKDKQLYLKLLRR